MYRVIHKSLRDFRPLRYISRDGHAEGEHVNRRRDTSSFCPTLQVLDMPFLGDAADINPAIKFLPHSLHRNLECLSLCWHAPLRRDHPGYCIAEVRNPGGTYELLCTYLRFFSPALCPCSAGRHIQVLSSANVFQTPEIFLDLIYIAASLITDKLCRTHTIETCMVSVLYNQHGSCILLFTQEPKFHSHKQTARSGVLLEKLTDSQLIKKFPHIWGPEVHYRTHNSTPPVPVITRSIQSMPPFQFLKIHFNIILSTPRSSK